MISGNRDLNCHRGGKDLGFYSGQKAQKQKQDIFPPRLAN